MTNAGRKATVALVAAAAMMVAGRANAQDEPTAAPGLRDATIVLHVTNYAALSRDVLDVARARVAMVYERIGVRIVWVDGEVSLEATPGRPAPLQHSAALARHGRKENLSATVSKTVCSARRTCPAGARPSSAIASRRLPAPCNIFAIPLGDVIAHEVGHLVLGANSHSRSGIMRAHTDVRALHLQSFDKAQARTIRTTLMEVGRVTER